MPKKKDVYDTAIKEYAKAYGISVVKDKKPKTIQELTTDVYKYEIDNKIKKGLFPFLKLDW